MENNRPLRVAAIHDLSGFGRCSLTVIIPVLSAMGVQVCPVPTAVLSTHTGGLGDPVTEDLTEYIKPALSHYKNIGVEFESVYSGFLGSSEQVSCCLDFFNEYPKALKLVDPVMGDNGRAYRTCGDKIQSGMKKLVSAADIITPNITEAAMLLDIKLFQNPLSIMEARSLLLRLSSMGPGKVVVHSCGLSECGMANIGYDRDTNAFWYCRGEYLPVSYPGCGDIFASVLLGSILQGSSLPMAMAKASSFTETCVKTTFSYGTDTRYGVAFENVIGKLLKNEVYSNFETL